MGPQLVAGGSPQGPVPRTAWELCSDLRAVHEWKAHMLIHTHPPGSDTDEAAKDADPVLTGAQCAWEPRGPRSSVSEGRDMCEYLASFRF